MVNMGHPLDVPSPWRERWSTSTIPSPWSLGGIASSGHPGMAGSGHPGPPRGIRYWFENAASNDAVGRGQMSERMNPTASFAPCRRSMPASSHSTEMGPV